MPQTLAQLWSFMGLANYHRKFIENYAEIARPLYELQDTKSIDQSLKKRNGGIKSEKIKLNWTKDAKEIFYRLKETLTSDKVLIMPDYTREFLLHTDASEKGYGAVLAQERIDGIKPIAFYSKSMTKAQLKYSVLEKELLAIVMSTEHFHLWNKM